MKPTYFKGWTHELGAPKDWDEARDGKCDVLPVMDQNGTYYSIWRPSFVERLKILFGAPLCLGCVSVQPAVALAVAKRRVIQKKRFS